MKYSVVFLLLIGSFFFSTNRALADSYYSMFVGINVLTDSNLKDTNLNDNNIPKGWELSFEPGFAVGGAVGTDITPDMRAELEGVFRFNNFGEIGRNFGGRGMRASTSSLMVNVFYDFHREGWMPYIGGGLGLAVISLERGIAWEGNKVQMAGQLGAGIVTSITKKTDLTFDYRLLITEDPEFEDLGFKADYIAHTFAVGLRVKF